MPFPNAPLIHHLDDPRRLTCGVPVDRRDPTSTSWRDVSCPRCLEMGYVEVRLGRWTVHTPEDAAESALLVLEGAASLIEHGRSARELRYPMRRLLGRFLQARLPGDPDLRGLKIRLFHARPGQR
jgi:hypothetical protein